MDAFEVLHKGALTTVQDLGRYGYQRYGVSISGAMDKFALRVGNLLVGNPHEGEGAIEITLLGPRLKVLHPTLVAFTGADLSAQINGLPAPTWSCQPVAAGDVISFGPPRNGCRAYIAVSGGIDVPITMASRSTHLRTGLGGLGRALHPGDIISARRRERELNPLVARNQLARGMIPVYFPVNSIRVILGPQEDYFTPEGLRTFLTAEFTISSESDRMGYRMAGPRIEHRKGADIITDATPPGSVQVPGDGMPIILMADGQTTGGYPKIAGVITPDLDKLGQAKPGDRVRFTKVEIHEAHGILREMESAIQAIRKSMALYPME